MSPTLAPAARERRRAATRLLERALLGLTLLCLLRALGRASSGPDPPAAPLPPLVVDVARDPPWRLVHLPGIGPSRAAAIVRDRLAHGRPQRLDDLVRIPGIGPGRLAALRAAREVLVVCDGEPGASPGP
jgi:competence protein ComEA